MRTNRFPICLALAALASAACEGSTDPDGETPLGDRVIVFSRDGDIWRMNGDGTGQANLTHSPEADDNPTWSGREILFSSARGGVPQLFRMDEDGRNVVQLTRGEQPAAEPAPAPDGQRVAFTTAAHDLDVAILQADGSVRTVAAPAGHQFSPAWSPSGDRIAFAHEGPDPGIYTVRPDGTGLTRLGAGSGEWPSWSPDGQRLVVLGGDEPSPRPWVVRVDGSGARPLTGTEFFAGAPDWSSDGEWIVFPSARPAPAGFWVVRPDGTGLRRLPYTGTGQFPRWRPLPQRFD